MALPEELLSRKLAGLLIVLAVLFLLFVAYLIASIWVDVSETIVTAISTTIGSLGIGHQASQAAQDRAQAFSPNWPVPPAAPPSEPRPGDPVH